MLPVEVKAVTSDEVGMICFNDKYFKNHAKNYKAIVGSLLQYSQLVDYYEKVCQ